MKGGKFKLDKGNGSSITAAYNPYFHTSRSPLNDQFSSAYKRDNLVTVECEVPASELTSGYRAEGAKDAVGEMPWHSGPVSSRLAQLGQPRKVILSRYVKVNRIVPDTEVAGQVAKMLNGTDIAIPENVVTPSLRDELRKQKVILTPRKVVQEALNHSRQALQDIANGKEYGVLQNTKYGEIRYPLGKMGKGGYGLLHIVESRMQRDGNTIDEAIDIAIKVGAAVEIGIQTASQHNTRHFDYDNVRAIIALMPDGNKVITGYEIKADDSPVANQRADDLQSTPHVRSEEIVAALRNNLTQKAKSASSGTQFSYHSAENTNADIDFDALSDEKASLYGEIIEATLDFGYDILKDRVFANLHDWREAMLDELGELYAQNGFSNANIKQIFDELSGRRNTPRRRAHARRWSASPTSSRSASFVPSRRPRWPTARRRRRASPARQRKNTSRSSLPTRTPMPTNMDGNGLWN